MHEISNYGGRTMSHHDEEIVSRNRSPTDFRTMPQNSPSKLDQVDTSSTARIDRRQTVIAQIEAALLADKLSVMELREENTGTDPYNSGVFQANPWKAHAR